MEQKQEFVSLLSSDHFTMSELCKTFGISRKTGRKWGDRYTVHGLAGLVPQSRAPKSVTCRTDDAVERLIVAESAFIQPANEESQQSRACGADITNGFPCIFILSWSPG